MDTSSEGGHQNLINMPSVEEAEALRGASFISLADVTKVAKKLFSGKARCR